MFEDEEIRKAREEEKRQEKGAASKSRLLVEHRRALIDLPTLICMA